jgi:hypothetical protein
MSLVASALKDLQPDEQTRVLDWAVKKFGVAIGSPAVRTSSGAVQGAAASGVPEEDGFTEFAELFSAASPRTDVNKALVAGYWAQVIGKKASFQSQELNAELKHLGHHIGNITAALDALIAMKPQLALQLRKAGNTRQARKTYKLSTAGVDAVKKMLRGEASANGNEA